MKKHLLLASTVIAGGVMGLTAAYAVTQGTEGPTSAGDFEVQLEIDNEVKISNLADIDMGVYDGADLTAVQDVCVYFNQDAPYSVVLDSNDTPGTFELEIGGETIPYTVEYADSDGTFEAVTAGTPLTGLNTATNTTDDDCVTNADNAQIQVSALEADITGNPNGVYVETIDITVSPDI